MAFPCRPKYIPPSKRNCADSQSGCGPSAGACGYFSHYLQARSPSLCLITGGLPSAALVGLSPWRLSCAALHHLQRWKRLQIGRAIIIYNGVSLYTTRATYQVLELTAARTVFTL